MKNKKKAQAALEILVIFGVLIIGAIFFGIFYFSYANKNIGNSAALDDTITDFEKEFATDASVTPDIDLPIINLTCSSLDQPIQFSPSGGMFYTPITVNLNYVDPNCNDYNIYYTTDGNEPTISSILYDSEILIFETTTLTAKVFAIDSSGNLVNSDSGYQQYIIQTPICLSSGSGTQADPKIICTAKDLHNIRYDPQGWYYLQGQDIDLNHELLSQLSLENPDNGDYNWYNADYGWLDISSPDNNFQGVYDGNNYIIKNLYSRSAVFDSAIYASSLFGYAENAEFNNINLVDLNSGTAGLIFSLHNGRISNVHETGELNYDSQGGLAAYIYNSDINNCSFSGSLFNTQSAYVGGLVGYLTDSNISNSYTVIGQIGFNSSNPIGVGGLVGYVYSGSSVEQKTNIDNSYSVGGEINGDSMVGGLVGYSGNAKINNCYSDNNVITSGLQSPIGGLIGVIRAGTITNSYSTGKVVYFDLDYAGGLIGSALGSSNVITSSYWDINTSGMSISAGGTGKTTTQMKKKETFTGWDFSEVWDITENITYPFFK